MPSGKISCTSTIILDIVSTLILYRDQQKYVARYTLYSRSLVYSHLVTKISDTHCTKPTSSMSQSTTRVSWTPYGSGSALL